MLENKNSDWCTIFKTKGMHTGSSRKATESHSDQSDQSVTCLVEKCFWLCVIQVDWSILFHCRVPAEQWKGQPMSQATRSLDDKWQYNM